MTPKSLLRHPGAASSLNDLAHGSFRAVVDDPQAAERPDEVERLVLCSGKVAYDLLAARERGGSPARSAVVRVELLYPFPADAIRGVLQRYGAARDVIWAQEEPCNMGAWWYIEPRLRALLPDGISLTYVGRPERAATAEGSPEVHVREQARIVEFALGQSAVQPPREAEVQNVG
jgi:2-oxoglutarate dehydrogenase E1 component